MKLSSENMINISMSFHIIIYFYKPKLFCGKIDFNSTGANDLSNTNKLESNIVNDLIYNSNEFFSDLGLKTIYSLNFKNLNSLGKVQQI